MSFAKAFVHCYNSRPNLSSERLPILWIYQVINSEVTGLQEIMSDPIAEIDIAANLTSVRDKIRLAALRSGRDPADIALVAVSKTKPLSVIAAAYAAGQRDFGENRLEELWQKVDEAPGLGLDQIRWHMIGTIQSRKSARAVGPFELIHSVDRLKIARRLSRDAEAADCVLPVLLEVNVSGETSKHGFDSDQLRAEQDELDALAGIRIDGLMTMAPFVEDESIIRPIFRRLREVRDEMAGSASHGSWHHLSMGMTNDFEIAVEEGATIVRVGSAIFGARNYR